VVAVDTPDNLTARLKGAATMYVQVDAPGADAGAALAAVRGVTRVTSADQPRGPVGPDLPPPQSTGPLAFEVESEPDVDVRRDLARAVVSSGWGLLELRPLRISLEDVFLSLTTEEVPAQPSGSAPVPAGELVNE
jgi:ABC-2 type transport system ATP-binding protein